MLKFLPVKSAATSAPLRFITIVNDLTCVINHVTIYDYEIKNQYYADRIRYEDQQWMLCSTTAISNHGRNRQMQFDDGDFTDDLIAYWIIKFIRGCLIMSVMPCLSFVWNCYSHKLYYVCWSNDITSFMRFISTRVVAISTEINFIEIAAFKLHDEWFHIEPNDKTANFLHIFSPLLPPKPILSLLIRKLVSICDSYGWPPYHSHLHVTILMHHIKMCSLSYSTNIYIWTCLEIDYRLIFGSGCFHNGDADLIGTGGYHY